MRRSLAAALLVSAATTAVATTARAQDAKRLTAFVDSIANAAVAARKTAGVSIAVVKNGRVLLSKGYGFADLENDVPATPATVYRIGSLTKQFTAAGIMRLAERGKLSLDDTLQKFLPGFPTQGNRVTIRHLLNHTSGIKSYTSLGPKWLRIVRLDVAPDTLVTLFANEPFDFKPGDAWAYDNSGYFLLGMIIEKVSGQSYATFLDTELFRPLGLASTRYCDTRSLIRHRAQGYQPAPGGQLVNADMISMTQPYAAGALCSTVGDLATWTAALASGKVVSAASYAQMSTPLTLNNGKPLTYGFGLSVGALRGHRQVHHNGGINGFVSELHHYVDDSLVTVVLTNVGAGTGPQLERLIATRALAIPDTAPPPVAAADLARYTGDYALGPMRIRVTADSGRLTAQATGQGPIALRHLGAGRFRAELDEGIVMEFPASTGPVPSFVLRQNGGMAVATRVP